MLGYTELAIIMIVMIKPCKLQCRDPLNELHFHHNEKIFSVPQEQIGIGGRHQLSCSFLELFLFFLASCRQLTSKVDAEFCGE